MSKALQLSVCELWWRKKKFFVQADIRVTCLGSFSILHVGMDVKRCVYQKETALVSRTSASPSLPSTVVTGLVLGQTVEFRSEQKQKCLTSVFVWLSAT